MGKRLDQITYEKTSMIIHIWHELFFGIDSTKSFEIPSNLNDQDQMINKEDQGQLTVRIRDYLV